MKTVSSTGLLTETMVIFVKLEYVFRIYFTCVILWTYLNVTVHAGRRSGNGCKNGTLKCHPDAECIDGEFRGARCRCKKGFHGTGRFCEDTDECAYKNGGCVHFCHNTKGNYSCECKNGFQLDIDGKNCVDKNECFENKGGCQHQCKNTLGGYECKCNQGYSLEPDGKKCKVGTYCQKYRGCEHSCRTTPQGSVICTCRNGFKLHSNTKTCIQTCKIGNGGCQHVCTDKQDGVTCSCAIDYILSSDNKTCTATCNVSNGGCSKKCKDTKSGPVCTCPDGYELHQDEKSCLDINECAVNNGNCSHNCTNVAGSYTCDCPKGHEVDLNGKTCIDINECDINGTCDHICINKPGTYTCKCKTGYDIYGMSHCADRDECSDNNGGCQHNCINTQGSYKCVCDAGYKLNRNGKDCVEEDKCYELPSEPAANTSCENRDSDILCIHKCKNSKYKFTVDTEQSVMSTHCGPGTRYNWDHDVKNISLPSCSSEISTPSIAKKIVMKFTSLECQKRTSVRKKAAQNITSILNSSKQFKCKGNCEIVDSVDLKCTKIIHRFTGGRVPPGGYSISMELYLAYKAVDKDKKNCNSKCEMKKTEKKLKKIVKKLKQAVGQKIFKFGLSGRSITVEKFKSPRGATKKICNKNWMLVNDVCVGCPAGSYFNRQSETCVKCSPGFYQDEEAQRRCKKCRKTSKHHGIYGAASPEECEVLCEPGHYSKNGLKPCNPCPKGSYQPEYGRLSCQKCPGKLTTSEEMSTSFRNCETKEICEAGHYYDVTKSECSPCQRGFYQPHRGRNYCKRCPGTTTTDIEAADKQMDCKNRECGQVFNKGDFSGFIQSPNYPGDYPTNVSCVWKIRPTKDRRILVIVPEVFFPPGCKDRLVMRKSKNEYSTVSYEECKTTTTPAAFIARSKRLWLHFQSDGTNTAKGFSIPFVTFNPMYQRLIESIITDGNLYKSEAHQAVLKDLRRLPILMEVIEKPELFFLKNNDTEKLFPPTFIKLLKKKVARFYFPRYN
ncbi:signal peptide protein [Mactra antiquata]